MTDIRHIVFDIGKVLIHYDPELPYLDLIPDAERRAWFLSEVCTNEWNVEQDRGRTWEDAEALLVERHPGEERLIRAFRQRWHEMVPHAHDETVAIMLGLIDAGYDVTLLTNFAADTFAEARRRYDFLDRPRGVTVSGEVRHIKPDAEIFRIHAQTFGLTPAETLFIDDSPKNVEGAHKAGWQAIRFTDAATLEKDLERLGVRR